jgi:glycosyltransferase involved in cell wall biosynthesis
MDQKPTVSVVMITYNHEKYIAEAMNGVFMQKCDFDIEFIIANDKSTDHTNQAINEIIDQTTIPDHLKMRYYNHPNNKGMMKNFIWSLNQAKGKYIALCEGDDYWTDPLKLQKQVDFLEGNLDYSMCFHRAKVTSDSFKMSTSIFFHLVEKEYTGEEILKEWSVPTASVVFRNKYDFDVFNKHRKGLLFGDILLFLYLATKGKLYCLADEMSVYRRNQTGVSVTGQFSSRDKIEHYKVLKKKLSNRFTLVLNQLIQRRLFKLAKLAYAKNKYIKTLLLLKEMLLVDRKIFYNKIIRNRFK